MVEQIIDDNFIHTEKTSWFPGLREGDRRTIHQIFHDALERVLIKRGDVRALIAFYEHEYDQQKLLTQPPIQGKLE